MSILSNSNKKITKYLEIVDVKKIDKDKYEVILISEYMGEGLIYESKLKHYYIYEEGLWKLNRIEFIE